MFEQLPEKAPHAAGYWIVLIALAGGVAGAAAGYWLFGEAAFQTSNAVMFGSFGVGALVGLVAGWRLIVPRGRRTQGSQGNS
jgi:hypothetical protein